LRAPAPDVCVAGPEPRQIFVEHLLALAGNEDDFAIPHQRGPVVGQRQRQAVVEDLPHVAEETFVLVVSVLRPADLLHPVIRKLCVRGIVLHHHVAPPVRRQQAGLP
jgi:hypothetical protein